MEEGQKDSSFYFKSITKYSIIFLSCIIILVIIPLLIGLAVSTVNPMQFGIEVDGNTRQINKEILYSGGRYFVGLNHYFITFPRYNQYILLSSKSLTYCKYNHKLGNMEEDKTVKDNSVYARTKDGIKIIIDIAVDYQLTTQKQNDQILSQLLYIYYSVGFEWAQLIINISRGVMTDIISQYSVFEINSKRSEIQNLLNDELKFELASQNYQLNSAVILNIEVPKEFLNSTSSIEVTQQNILSSQAIYSSLQINATTRINNANIDSQIINYSASNKAQEIMKVKYSIGNMANYKYNTLLQSLYNFKNTLNIKDKTNRTAASQLLTYYWLKVMQNKGNSQKMVNLDLPENLKEK